MGDLVSSSLATQETVSKLLLPPSTYTGNDSRAPSPQTATQPH